MVSPCALYLYYWSSFPLEQGINITIKGFPWMKNLKYYYNLPLEQKINITDLSFARKKSSKLLIKVSPGTKKLTFCLWFFVDQIINTTA